MQDPLVDKGSKGKDGTFPSPGAGTEFLRGCRGWPGKALTGKGSKGKPRVFPCEARFA